MAVDDFTGPVNLGNPEEIPVLDVAETIIKLTKSSSKIIHKSLPADDPLRRCPDISLAKEKLGWKPRISLEEGLDKTIAYFKEILHHQ
jgi:UDP-glucuronate decarboxylase